MFNIGVEEESVEAYLLMVDASHKPRIAQSLGDIRCSPLIFPSFLDNIKRGKACKDAPYPRQNLA